MGDAVQDGALDEQREEETEETDEIEDKDEDEEMFVIAREEELDIFDNLSRKHNEQTPGDCRCFGCFLQVFAAGADDLFGASIVCVCVYFWVKYGGSLCVFLCGIYRVGEGCVSMRFHESFLGGFMKRDLVDNLLDGFSKVETTEI